MNLLAVTLVFFFASSASADLVPLTEQTVLETSTGREWTKDANPLKTLTYDNAQLIDQIIDSVPGRIIPNAPNYWDREGVHRLTRDDFQYVSAGSMDHEWYDSATWWGAQAFIAYLNKTGYAGHNDWRLPHVQPQNGLFINYGSSFNGATDVGYNIISPTSELSHLFYVELGNRGFYKTNGVPWALPTGVTHAGPFVQTSNEAYWSGPEYSPEPNYAWNFATVSGAQSGYGKNHFYAVWPVR